MKALRAWLCCASLCVLGLFGTTSAQSGTVSGTVLAAPNSDVQNTLVSACSLQTDTCDNSTYQEVRISTKGKSARYQLQHLSKVQYIIIAWRDLNGNGQMDAGDEVGTYMPSGKVSLVTAPASNIAVQLKPFNGDVDAFFAGDTTQANQAPPAVNPNNPALLRGEFSNTSTSLIQYQNSFTGQSAPISGNGSTYSFKGDGTFELYLLIQQTTYNCTSTAFANRKGTFKVNGDQLTLTYKGGQVKFTNTCSPSMNSLKPANLGTDQYRWRIVTDPNVPGALFLELTDAKGNTTRYMQRK